TEIYTLSLHDALLICKHRRQWIRDALAGDVGRGAVHRLEHGGKRARRIEVPAGRQPRAAGDGGTQVRQDVAEQVRRHDDVEVDRTPDEIHAGGVDEQRLGPDAGVVTRDSTARA